MARAIWMLVKWVVIPVALAAAGYYVIGPRIGGSKAPIADKPGPSQNDPPPQPATTAENSDGHPTTYPEPDVSVTRGASRDGVVAPRRHRRHRADKPKRDGVTTDKANPPGDQGGSGGAATTGGTTGGGDTGGTTGGGDTGGSGTTGADTGGGGGTNGFPN